MITEKLRKRSTNSKKPAYSNPPQGRGYDKSRTCRQGYRVVTGLPVPKWRVVTLWYCWWKKSCTSWNVKKPVNNGINYQSQLVSQISEPSTVVSTCAAKKNVFLYPHLPSLKPTVRTWKWTIPKGNEKVFKPSQVLLLLVSGKVLYPKVMPSSMKKTARFLGSHLGKCRSLGQSLTGSCTP